MEVFVIDDEEMIPFIFEAYFRREIGEGRLRFRYFSRASEFLGWAESRGALDPHAPIFTDIQMPDMPGTELSRRLRDRGVPNPIFLMSAHESADWRAEFGAFGITDFFEKPFVIARIRETLLRWLDVVSGAVDVPTARGSDFPHLTTAHESGGRIHA